MCFNRKNAEQKNWRMIKKGKHFLFGCSLVFAVGATLVAPSVKADTVEAKPETSSTTDGTKPVVSEENPTYAAPAVEVAPVVATGEKAEKPVEPTQNSEEEPVVATEEAKEADSIQAPEVTVVYNPAALTDEEKAKVVAAVKAANPTATDVQVQADGSVVVAFADGSRANLTAAQTIKDGSLVAKPRTNRALRATAPRASEGAENLEYTNKKRGEVVVDDYIKISYKVDNAKNVIHWTTVVNGGRVGNAASGYTYFTVPKDSVGTPTNWRVLQTDKNGKVMSDRNYWKNNDGSYVMGAKGLTQVYTGAEMTKKLAQLYKGIGNPALKGKEAAASAQAAARSQALYTLTADVAGGWLGKNPSWTITYDTPILDKSKPLDYVAGLQGTGGAIGAKTEIMTGFADNFIDNASSKFQAVAVKETYTAKVGESFNADPATYVTNKAGTPEFPNNYRGATTFAWKDGQAPTATTPGTYTKTVVVTYPAHYKQAPQEVTITFEVKDPRSDADKYTPVAKDQTVKPGDKPSAKDSIGNVGDLPEGTTFEFKTPVDTATDGEKDATVVVTYPDKSTEEVPVKVTVKTPDADKYTPVAKDQTVKPGDKPSAKDSIGNVGDLPSGTTFEFKTPVDTATDGEKDATVVVTYPDKSTEEVPVKVTVKTPDADKYTPVAKDQTVKPGDKPSAKDSIGNVGDLPEGTTFEFKTPVDTATDGEKDATVVVTYPDKSTEEVPVKVTVKTPDADKYTPVAKDQTVKPGDKPSAKDSIGNVGDLPSGTTFEFKTPVDTATDGEKDATVVVTYPDKSTEEVPVKVTVKTPDADKYTPVAKDQTVKPGDKPSAKDSIGNVGDLPSGTTFEFKTPVDTATDGEKDATVVVTYPDKSTEEVPVKVTVKTPDADKYTPVAKDQTVKPGDKPSAKDSIGNVGDLPEGTTFEFKTPVDTATDGEKDATVVVTYPDKSTEEVPVKVTVKTPDADKYTPVAKDQTVKPGDKPSAKDSIGNVGDLPSGTTFEFKTPVDTATDGEKDATVVVTYPDKSTEEVPVKVTVKTPDADKYTPVAKDQTVKPGDKPSAKDSIGNVGDLPEGTTFEFKTPVDTATDGEKDATVVVTYPDKSTEEVPVKVTVKTPDADKYTPVAKDQTVKPGDKPSAKDSIGNVGDLPSGTTFEFKTPVDTATDGEKDATVVVTYPDGSKDEVPAKVTVKTPSTDADKNTPVAKDQTVKPGDKPSAKDSIGNVGDLPSGTTFEFKTPVDTATDGEKDATVVVTYPDKSTEEVPVKVTVKTPDADKYTPVAKDQTVKPGDKPSAKDSIGNVGDLPSGTTFEFKTPVDTATDGEKDATVVVTYPDKSTEEVPVKVTVKTPDADKYTPVAKDQTVKPGDKPSAKDSIGNVGDLPEGTTFEFKTPVDTATDGEKDATVVVTYPDKSTEEVPVKVTVKTPDADKYTPVAKDQTVKPGDKPSAKDSIGNVGDLPSGTTFEFKTPVDTATDGEKDATVVVTYPDGSKDEVPAKVTVKTPSTDADKNTPVAKDQTVKPGDKPSAKDSIGNVGDLPSGTTFEFKTPVDTATDGEKDATVVVTYPDKSTEEVPVKVTVKAPDADKYTPVAKDQTVKPGDKPSAKDSIGNVGDLPSGTTFEFKTPVDTATDGEKDATVVVTYPDKSTEEVPVKVTVKTPDADKYTPVAKDQTVKPGDKPSAKDSIGNVGDLPSGTTFEFKTPVDTATDGEKDATVVVTYPDGSKDEVPAKVTVKTPSTDADKNTPVAKDQTVKPGDKPSAKDSIGNVGDLPSGTTFEFKTPVDTATDGEKDATVVVTYPDKSTEEVPVKVTVKTPDADKYTPVAKDQTVKPGDKPSAKDSIGNVGDLPSGTTFEFKTPVDTATDGEKDATVVVTYPDGSKDEVPAKVTVKTPSTDADKNTPVAKDQTVKPGDKPSAKDSIGNVGDLPSGTTFEFKTPVDTATDGEKDATVVVTYPDGSKDEVPAKVTVKTPSTDADKNTPVAKDQTVKPGDKPSAKDSIGNVGDLPSGTTFEFKTPVDTATDGEKDATVVVTYPDKSTEEVPVKVTVKTPDADKYTPVAKDQTVKPGDKPSAKDSIGNVGDLPSGTTFEFKTPVDTATDGEKDATVVVTYPDGSKDEVPAKVTVKTPSTDADKNTPVAKDQTVKPGDKPSAKDSIGNVGDLPSGTTFEFKTPVDTATDGEKDATVVVTYPDGSKDEVPAKVTVKTPSTDADKNTPVAKDQTVKPGDKPSAKDSIGNVGDLPSGTTFEFKTPVDTATDGEKDATVVVTYPDKSTEEVPVKVTVKTPDADKYTPVAKDQTVKPGDKPSAKDSIGNVGDLPSGTTFEFKTPVDTATDGEKDATVVVTYPDGSKDEVPAKVTVKTPSTDADKNTPVAKDQTVKPGDKPSAKDSIGNVGDLPSGTTFEFKTPVDTATDGEKDATVVVTYPDGSKDEVPAKVTVKTPSTDADKNTPVAKDQTVKPGDKPSAKDSIGNVGDLPSGTTFEFKTPVDTATDGEKDATVVVTYPDGSKDEVPAKVTVKTPSTDADKYTPVAKDQTVKPGDKPSAKDSIGNVGDLPSGTTFEFKTPVDTATDGEKDATVVVTYPDGSKDEVPAKVTVKTPSTDADKNTPVAKDQTVKPGDKPSAKDSIGNVGDLPSGTTFEFKTPVDTATDGEKDATVVVTYPDGSKDEVPAKVTVKTPSTDADKNTPVAKDQTVKPGDKPSAKDSIGNVGDLPSGTTFEFKTPVDTATDGEKDATVVVTYPDGSKDEVPAKVTVKTPSTDADKNTPVAKDQTVKPGDKPSAKDSIGNVGDLPSGTTFEFKTPVDTATDGEKDATVVVTYPDGSKDEVPAKVTVKTPSTDADKNTPVAKDQTVKPGDKPSAKDSIGNVGDLPSGTTFEFKTPVDTATDGEKDATVVVTYPDGSKDEVPAKVTVKTPSTDADKNTPVAKDQTVKPGDKPSAKDSIGNVGDLPSGTTFEFKTPVDTATDGEKDATVVVTYPDGSKDEVPAKVTVKTPSTDADKNTPVAKDQTVKPGDKPSAKDSIGNVGDLPSGTTFEFKTPVDTATDGEKDATVVVTYPDGSKDEVPAKVTVKTPTKEANAPSVTPVVNPSSLTEAEKAKVANEVKKANPTATDVKVGNDGTTTVIFPDGSKAILTPAQTVKEADSSGVKTPSVTPVVNPSSLTDAEKAKVAEEVKKANPTATDVKVNNDGSVVVTFADGSVATIAANKVVKEATKESSAQAPSKKAGAKELPNTGTKQSNASLGLALLAAVTGGLLISKKRKEEE